MAELTITDVIQAEPSDDLLAAHIDSPVGGSDSDVLFVQLFGWALGRTSPVVNVEVVHGGVTIREHRRASVCVARPDIARVHPDVAEDDLVGFDIPLGTLVLADEFELKLVGVLADDSRVPLGVVRGRHRPLRHSFEPRLQPILVTTLGRTGGTWLMRMLGKHPQVVVYPAHPYESMPAHYWMRTLVVVSQPAGPGEPPARRADMLAQAGHNPFFDPAVAADPELGRWRARDYVETAVASFQHIVDGWYTTLGRRLGLEGPRYFAEKNAPNEIALVTRRVYPRSRELFLVRDLRDMVCSMLAFNRKRGHVSFDQNAGETDEDFIRRFGEPGSLARLLSASWRERSQSSQLVRYEDLVRAPEQSLARVLDYLELDSSPELVREIVRRASEETPELAAHRTSPDPHASIGRWRRERDDSFGALCDESFGDLLEDFGYERAEAVLQPWS